MKYLYRNGLLLCAFVILCSLPARAQSWQDLATYKQVNFDKLLVGTDKMITVAPPAGKYWVIVAGSLQTDRMVDGAVIAVWTETPPFLPGMSVCVSCVTLITVDAGKHMFLPIVGGYSEGLQGQTMPLVITYPNRLVIAVSRFPGGLAAPLQTWTRFTIVEKDVVVAR